MNHSLRSAVVLVLLFGTAALAVPSVTRLIDGWLFSDGSDTRSKWREPESAGNDTGSSTGATLLPADPDLQPIDPLPVASQDRGSFAFDFQEVSPAEQPAANSGELRSPIVRAEHREEVVATGELAALEESFRQLNADYVVVEQVAEGDQFECRCLMQLSPQSSYQKAFSAMGSNPEAAMRQVLAEVRAWRRNSAGERLFRN
jgi:hypothetical protein